MNCFSMCVLESVAEKVLNYFDKLSTISDQNSKIIREGIASSVGNYEAVVMPAQHFLAPVTRPMPSLPSPPITSAMRGEWCILSASSAYNHNIIESPCRACARSSRWGMGRLRR